MVDGRSSRRGARTVVNTFTEADVCKRVLDGGLAEDRPAPTRLVTRGLRRGTLQGRVTRDLETLAAP